MRTRTTTFRLRALLVLSLLAGFLVWSGSSPQTQQAQAAADPWAFQAGNIISDAVYFDANTMTAGDIQAFLNARNPSCTSVAGWHPCLKDLRQDTPTRYADAQCNGTYWGAAGESAATIIYKVAQACGINPRVLLVMLQKEQGLVLAKGSSLDPRIWPNRYRAAMGMGCPDTAACDSQYYGFFNQVYGAAHQLQRYADYPNNYSYRPNAWNTILFSPRGAAACGSSSVYIANKATAGLYNYTPYQPNTAALAAGYGSGDSCSAYGNRNFFLYFTDWFGTTGAYTTEGGIGELWRAEGGGTGYLGYPAGAMVCGLNGGGCGQHFQGGSIYWSPATGTHAVSGSIRYVWSIQGWQAGGLGYPTARMTCGLAGGGCLQSFQGGQILWSEATGARTMTTDVVRAWNASGGLAVLGYATGDPACGLVRGGCQQGFQGGTAFTSPATGAHFVTGAMRDHWAATGAERGSLGYPATDMKCSANGCEQGFETGRLGWTATNGVRLTNGAIGERWVAEGGGAAPIGHPVAEMVCGLQAGGCRQDFQGGTVYWSGASGAWLVTGDVAATWRSGGAETSFAGYPTGKQTCTSTGCVQPFQRQWLAGSALLGVHGVSGAIGERWTQLGGLTGELGLPTADMVCGLTSGGCRQEFQVGSVHWSPATGAHAVNAEIGAAWTGAGGAAGSLGYPTGATKCGLAGGGCRQAFQGGLLYWSPASGGHPVSGAIESAWTRAGAESGRLGYPTAAAACTAGGCSQQFQNGQLAGAAGRQAQVVEGAVAAYWTGRGAGAGPLGYPLDTMRCGLVGGGCLMTFQGGTVYSSPATGTYGVFGAVFDAWARTGYEFGPLGYPAGDMVCTAGGCSQKFQYRSLGWTPQWGAHVVEGAIADYWTARGAGTGPLGQPIDDMRCGLARGGCLMSFQGGTVYWSSVSGTHAVFGAIFDAWARTGFEFGPLGYATTDMTCTVDGCTQRFQGGTLAWSPTGGTHTVSGALEAAWSGAGGAAGTLGYPTTEAYAVPGGRAQDFQGGRLTYDSASGTVNTD
jgi:uncharacterized protein with LGFP repeats